MRIVTTRSPARPISGFEPLPWDSAHFGFPVARIDRGDGGRDDLAAALGRARDDGFELVYLFTDPGEFVAPAILDRFAGRCVDERVTLAVDLRGGGPAPRSADFETRLMPRCEPTSALTELAVEAGACSRFAVDPRIPGVAFRRLYEVWIRRSCLGEAADAVLVTTRPGGDEPLGLATLSIDGDAASVGLVAVARDARGRGLGLLTMRQAHDWLRARGVRTATVATQGRNEPARRLYRACGYEEIGRRAIYHFWPRDAARS
jgi:GNAT superfamily N-acetyltransferase